MFVALGNPVAPGSVIDLIERIAVARQLIDEYNAQGVPVPPHLAGSKRDLEAMLAKVHAKELSRDLERKRAHLAELKKQAARPVELEQEIAALEAQLKGISPEF